MIIAVTLPHRYSRVLRVIRNVSTRGHLGAINNSDVALDFTITRHSLNSDRPNEGSSSQFPNAIYLPSMLAGDIVILLQEAVPMRVIPFLAVG